MLNPEIIEDNSYSMKTKCESLMKFVNKIEAYNVKIDKIRIPLNISIIIIGGTNIYLFKRD